ncbi:MAG: hypothetical protein HY296_06280 [Thaumarchaeota archaeon]|nr:hypothetical protein [Nitrososphaerota archaeon]
MGGEEGKADDLLDRLILDIKAFVLLRGTEEELKNSLRGALIESHDDSLQRFVRSLQGKQKPESRRLLAIALGELIMASLLIVAGTVALLPVMAGITSPQDLLNFFAGGFYGSIANSPLYQYAGFIEFALGASLMLGAFHTLRQAAASLREMGLSIRTGE